MKVKKQFMSVKIVVTVNIKVSCIKGNNCKTPLEERTKKLETSKNLISQRKEDLERIISEEGCNLE